jgi:hypothetical protein
MLHVYVSFLCEVSQFFTFDACKYGLGNSKKRRDDRRGKVSFIFISKSILQSIVTSVTLRNDVDIFITMTSRQLVPWSTGNSRFNQGDITLNGLLRKAGRIE